MLVKIARAERGSISHCNSGLLSKGCLHIMNAHIAVNPAIDEETTVAFTVRDPGEQYVLKALQRTWSKWERDR